MDHSLRIARRGLRAAGYLALALEKAKSQSQNVAGPLSRMTVMCRLGALVRNSEFELTDYSIANMSEPSEKKSQPLDYEQPAKPVEQVEVPRYRKIFSNILLLAGLVIGIVGIFEKVEAAKVDVWTIAASFIIMGIVIRFQHVRF